MLQLKTWSWNVNKPNGKTAKDIENEVNKFLKTHNCLDHTFDIYELSHGIMFGKVLYKIRKTKNS